MDRIKRLKESELVTSFICSIYRAVERTSKDRIMGISVSELTSILSEQRELYLLRCC